MNFGICLCVRVVWTIICRFLYQVNVSRMYISIAPVILSVQLMVFCYILGFSWILASVVLAVPVYLLSLLYFADFTVTKNGGVDTKCINLVHYGKYNMKYVLCWRFCWDQTFTSGGQIHVYIVFPYYFEIRKTYHIYVV